MKKILLSFVFAFMALYVGCQEKSVKEKRIIDEQFNEYIKDGRLIDASELLVDYAINLEKQGDTLLALQYQLKNCFFVDDHIDYFKEHLTPEEYFANWYITISLEGWLNKKNDGAKHLFYVLRKMQKEAPNLLPFYASTLAFIIQDCKDIIYRDSIYLLQPALDVIKAMPITKESVQQYIRINECFMTNRFYNSMNGVFLIENRFPEIRDWYIVNSHYIHNLDTNEYRPEILQYDFGYADMLYIFASTSSAQENDNIKAIKLYEEEITLLKPLLEFSDKPAQKIAACYAKISGEYYLLGDLVKCKEYSDKCIEYLFSHEEDFEYCDILGAVSLCYFNIGYHSIAAKLKLAEIYTRENLGWHCDQSDWSLYFLYSIIDSPENILLEKDKALSAESNDGGFTVFNYIGSAYSKLMDSDRIVVCSNCSLNNFCENICKAWCIAGILGGEYFVELNVEK